MSRLDDLEKNASAPTPLEQSTLEPILEPETTKRSDPARTWAILLFWLGVAAFAVSLVVDDRSLRDLLLSCGVAAIAITMMLAQFKLFSIASDIARIREIQETRHSDQQNLL